MFVPFDANFQISPHITKSQPALTDFASCSGYSSSAKLSDLAACSACRARTAPKHGESSGTKPVRRVFEVPDLIHKDMNVIRRLGLSGGVRVMYSAREGYRRVEGFERAGIGSNLGRIAARIRISPRTFGSGRSRRFGTLTGTLNYAHRGDLAPSRIRSDANDLKETAAGANSLRRVLDHKHAAVRLARRKPCDGSAPPTHSSL